MFQNLIDSHTHTLASGHAYNTIMEMARAAADKGLHTLAITEHAVRIPGSVSELYFMNLKTVPRDLCGIETLFGSELNIVDYEGHVDLRESILAQMDVCVASMHTPVLKPGTMLQHTKAYEKVCENPYVNIIGHPDDGRYPVDADALAAAAKKNHVLIELNNHSLNPKGSRENAYENDLRILERCAHYGTHIILDSDAHWMADIADTSRSLPLLEEIGFPMELVVNHQVDLYHSFINRQYT